MMNEQYKSIIVGLMIFSLLVSINLGGRRRLKKYTEIQSKRIDLLSKRLERLEKGNK